MRTARAPKDPRAELRRTAREAVKRGGIDGLRAMVDQLDEADVVAVAYDWRNTWARPCVRNANGTFSGQLPPPGGWDTWLVLSGRGFGKTRSGAEWVREEVARQPVRVAFVGQDPTDIRNVMIYGESGIMSVTPPDERPRFIENKGLLTWANGSLAEVHSSYDFAALRGPQFHRAWVDELCAMKYPRQTWDNLEFGMRLVAPDGSQPRTCITTTPKPSKLLKEIIGDSGTVVTSGSTYDNIDNLSTAYIKKVIRRYEGTSLGAQELYAQLMDEVDGALWTRDMIASGRRDTHPDLQRVVVAVDPAAGTSASSAETGIIVAGLGVDGEIYVLRDETVKMRPGEWAKRVVNLYHHHKADCIVFETNMGGDMGVDLIASIDQLVIVEKVSAARGKITRAEPVAGLYEQGRVHHVGPAIDFELLENQLCSYTGAPGETSPDRLDALVWAVFKLLLEEASKPAVVWV